MTFACPNCMREYSEPYCDCCGRNLAHNLVPSYDRGPRLTLVDERRGPQKEAA